MLKQFQIVLFGLIQNYVNAYVCKATNGTADVKMKHLGREIILLMFLKYSDFKYDIASVSDNRLVVYATDQRTDLVS